MGVFKQSLSAAIRDIEKHPRGKLFRRLVQYGPPKPDHPEVLASDGETTLSDPECGLCLDFIFSHMVNRFKGELAELLALEPCIHLLNRLQHDGRLPSGVHLYWGALVHARRSATKIGGESDAVWGNFTKAADGLFVRQEPAHTSRRNGSLVVYGIVEVKSMSVSNKRVLDQIEHHKTRLLGGVKLGSREWPPDHVRLACLTDSIPTGDGLIRIAVMPSRWSLSRQWHSVRVDARKRVIVQEPSEPPVQTQIERCGPDSWKITLAWSQEALHQAAYEMTFWYMRQVGASVFAEQPLPRGLEHLTPEEAGINQTKYGLFVIGLRYVSRRQVQRQIRIYNDYSFGFPFAADNRIEILWPDEFPDDDVAEEHE
jgi:hypothetical protein